MEMHFHQERHSTQNNPSWHKAQSTTCCECTANQAPTRPGDPHSTVRPRLPKCRLQKVHLSARGTYLYMCAANGKPELNVAIWTRCESSQSCGGAHTRFPHAVSALIMDLADKDFSSFATSRPQNQNPGLLPMPYHQINITPNINMLLIKVTKCSIRTS